MTPTILSVRPFGDRAALVEVPDNSTAHAVAAAIALRHDCPVALYDIVIGFRSVTVSVDGDIEVAMLWLESVSNEQTDSSGDQQDNHQQPASLGRTIAIPVHFDGPDLSLVAGILGTTSRHVATMLMAAPLEVAFLGFSPGFAYLVGLPPELEAVSRRPQPRTAVPAGSIAIAGGFASVYPRSTPGGWMLLGRTSLQLFDPTTPPFALLRAGDKVRFVEEAPTEPPHLGAWKESPPSEPQRDSLVATTERYVEVLDPGLFTTVQDFGRHGVAAIGIPRAGASDPDALVLANRLMGNDDGAAVLELAVSGPSLRFMGDAFACVLGAATVTLDGKPVATDSVLPIASGQILHIGAVSAGLRATVGINGGLTTPALFGSRASDVLSGMGVGPLMAGDELDLGPPVRPHGRLTNPNNQRQSGIQVLRALRGPHDVAASLLESFSSATFTVRPDSNRIGVRLEGPEANGSARTTRTEKPSTTDSCGMVRGAVQLPPDGRPIVLMADHATVGGYPVIATVITTDFSILGQLRAGDRVRFVLVSAAQANAAGEERKRRLGRAVEGWFPSQSGT